MPLIVKGALCGLTLFLVNWLFAAAESLSLLLIFSNLLPGFVFGWILEADSNRDFGKKSLAFIILSGLLYILVAWIATGPELQSVKDLKFPIASVIGSIGLMLLYGALVNKRVLNLPTLICAFIAGIIATLLQLLNPDLIFTYHVKYLEILAVLIIIPIWQILFCSVIYFSLKMNRATPVRSGL